MIYEIVIIILLAIICFLLYKLYRIKYTGGAPADEFIPRDLKKDLMETGIDERKEIELRFRDISSKISEFEKKLERNERVVEKLIEELG